MECKVCGKPSMGPVCSERCRQICLSRLRWESFKFQVKLAAWALGLSMLVIMSCIVFLW